MASGVTWCTGPAGGCSRGPLSSAGHSIVPLSWVSPYDSRTVRAGISQKSPGFVCPCAGKRHPDAALQRNRLTHGTPLRLQRQRPAVPPPRDRRLAKRLQRRRRTRKPAHRQPQLRRRPSRIADHLRHTRGRQEPRLPPQLQIGAGHLDHRPRGKGQLLVPPQPVQRQRRVRAPDTSRPVSPAMTMPLSRDHRNAGSEHPPRRCESAPGTAGSPAAGNRPRCGSGTGQRPFPGGSREAASFRAGGRLAAAACRSEQVTGVSPDAGAGSGAAFTCQTVRSLVVVSGPPSAGSSSSGSSYRRDVVIPHVQVQHETVPVRGPVRLGQPRHRILTGPDRRQVRLVAGDPPPRLARRAARPPRRRRRALGEHTVDVVPPRRDPQLAPRHRGRSILRHGPVRPHHGERPQRVHPGDGRISRRPAAAARPDPSRRAPRRDTR